MFHPTRQVQNVIAVLLYLCIITEIYFGLSAAKKLAPIPPKPYCQTGAMSDQSTGQPSPVSLSPTPPSTPSPYGFSYPQGYATIGSPGQMAQMATTPSLSSPPSLAGTLTKARPTPKPPRQRPSLPPPQPPSTPGTSPQPLDHSSGLLDGLSPGESMSTGEILTSISLLIQQLSNQPKSLAKKSKIRIQITTHHNTVVVVTLYILLSNISKHLNMNMNMKLYICDQSSKI